jgi:integrase
VLLIEREDVDMENGFFKAINIKSDDKHKVEREIPEHVFGDFQYFLLKSNSPFPFKVCHPDTLTQWIKVFFREANLSEDLHCHSLRHTFITLGLENNDISIRDMQKYIDHSTYRVTEVYAHDKTKRTPNLFLE